MYVCMYLYIHMQYIIMLLNVRSWLYVRSYVRTYSMYVRTVHNYAEWSQLLIVTVRQRLLYVCMYVYDGQWTSLHGAWMHNILYIYVDNAYKNYIVYYNYNISVAWHFNVMLLHTQSHIPFIHGYIWDYIVLHNKDRDCSILCMEVLEVCQKEPDAHLWNGTQQRRKHN